MRTRVVMAILTLSLLARPVVAQSAAAQRATTPSTAVKRPVDSAALAEARADAESKAFLEAEAVMIERRLLEQRALYLKGAAWAELGDRCNPGALRVFPKDTSLAQRDSLAQLVGRIEQTLIGRGVGSRLDTPEARALLRTIVGWEAGIDRPLWDVDDKVLRPAVATGLTGDVPDPRSNGCLPSPLASDTVTFVIPGFTDMEFPKAPKPRVKAYFGPEGQKRARDEFFTVVGSKQPEAELSYIVVAPVLIWRGWALVGVDRPREKGGIVIGAASNGGAVYLMRKVGTQWRLLTMVRSWGS